MKTGKRKRKSQESNSTTCINVNKEQHCAMENYTKTSRECKMDPHLPFSAQNNEAGLSVISIP